MIYLDTSALLKLVVRETESSALRSWLAEADGPVVTSALTRVELVRAARRVGLQAAQDAVDVLAEVATVRLDDSVLATAAALAPPELRSLDAIHLGTATMLGPGVIVVTYDPRMLEAAALAGLRVVAPGRT
ncbi:MAG: type II toxin-antitoxin system VapC family toxin [Actinomycetes bacterium]